MKPSEIESLMKAIAPVLRSYLRDELTPIRRQMTELERRVAEVETKGLEFVGTFQRAATYRRGQAVSFDGSLWIALRDTQSGEEPGQSKAWQLAVKRGRDGRDAA